MTTPRAAQHRDLEQRLRDLEAQVGRLTTRQLGSPRASLTRGNLDVAGGDLRILDEYGAVVWSALDGPFKAELLTDRVDTFALERTSDNGPFVSASAVVPDGYTRVLATGTVMLRARNTTAGQDYMYIEGTDAATDVAPGYVGHLTYTATQSAEGLVAGDSFPTTFAAVTGVADWSADAWNVLSCNVLYLWQR